MTIVIQKGGRINDQSRIVKEFEDHEEAKLYAKNRRKNLSPGERQYYKYSFIVKKIK